MKTEDPKKRSKFARLYGKEAKKLGSKLQQHETFSYQGRTIRTGTWEHWRLMKAACYAKFEQCEEAREALLRKGDRPLVHRTRRSNRTIPNPLMAASTTLGVRTWLP